MSLKIHTVTLVFQVNGLLAATLLISCHLHFKHLNSWCQVIELEFGQLSSRGSGALVVVVFVFAWLSLGQCHCGRVCEVVGGSPDCKSAPALPSDLTLTFCPPPFLKVTSVDHPLQKQFSESLSLIKTFPML